MRYNLHGEDLMELAHSRALVAIGELGSFSKAGARLHLSPPAIFAQIQLLERELGEKLYRRNGRKLELTPAGCVMIEHCHRLMRVHDEAIGAIKELTGVHRPLLRLGCGPHISSSLVPHLLRMYLTDHSDVELQLITGSDDMLFTELRAGSLDVIFMNLPVAEEDLVQDALWRYEMVFVVSPRDPLAHHSSVSVRDLEGHPFILYQRSRVIEAAIKQFCASVGFEPKVLMQNDQADSIKELVKLGVGIALLPLWGVSGDVRRGTLSIIRLADRHLYSVTGLIYAKSPGSQPALQALLDVAHQWKAWMPRPKDVLAL
jgi:DNA-binding transcriptional LysR family regulator